MRTFWSWLARTMRAHRELGTASRSGSRNEESTGVVRGERGETLVTRAASLQARLNTLLAGGLVVGIAVAMLVWYYRAALRHDGGEEPPAARRANASARAMGPPPLGSIPPPRVIAAMPAIASTHGTDAKAVPAAAGRASDAPLAAVLRLQRARAWRGGRRAGTHRGGGDLARRLAGGVFIGRPSPAAERTARARRVPDRAPRFGSAPVSGVTLHALLHPTLMRATRAQLLPEQHLLLAKGTFIDCTLETAIDTTLPGMTTCITATDTFSADGTVVLLPRGTQLMGQTRGAVRQGMARVFVIWTQARTPSGVVVRLDSPGTDSLGRSGLTGTVDRHFWQRFGAALLVSTLTGVVQSKVDGSGGAVIVDPTAGEDVLAQTLRTTQDIPPTIEVANGQRIDVLVARDVDFTPVYELVAR